MNRPAFLRASFLVTLFVLAACSDESSTMLDADSGTQTGTRPPCSCETAGATVEIVGACTWGDATECTGLVSAACAPDLDAGAVAPGGGDAGASECSFSAATVAPSGSEYTGWGCTLRLVCPEAN